MVSQSFRNFYRGKRVFLTGDTGFKGSWMALWLKELGAEVVGFALPAKGKDDHFCVLGLDKLIHHIDGDIRDHEAITGAVCNFRPEIVFHMAAQALVRDSYDDPKTTFDTNVAGSVNVLEAVRECADVKALVYVTSDKCYRNKEWHWGYRENEELGGHDPYSASKAAAEVIFSSYMASFFSHRSDFAAASVRAGNVIGGGDWAKDRVMPDCIRSLMSDKPIVLRNPNATRPWQHVLEPLSGYLLTAIKLCEDQSLYSGAWNFGPEFSAVRTVGDLAEKVVSCWGGGEIRIEKQGNGPHEATLLHLNCDKAHHLMNWWPLWNYDAAIENTVSWYKDVSQGMNILDVTTRQIRKYMEGMAT